MVTNSTSSLHSIPQISFAPKSFDPNPPPQNFIDPFTYFPKQNAFLDVCRGSYESLRCLLMEKLSSCDEYAQTIIRFYVKRFKSCGEHNMLISIERNDMDFFRVLAEIGVNLAEIDSKLVFDKVNNVKTFEFLLQHGFVFNKYDKDAEDISNEYKIMEKLYLEYYRSTGYWHSCGYGILFSLFKSKLSENWKIKDFANADRFASQFPGILGLFIESNVFFKAGSNTLNVGILGVAARILRDYPDFMINSLQNGTIHQGKHKKGIFTDASSLTTMDIQVLDKIASIFTRFREEKNKAPFARNHTVSMLFWCWKRNNTPSVLVNLFRTIKAHNIKNVNPIYSYFENTADEITVKTSDFWKAFNEINITQYMPELLSFMKRIVPSLFVQNSIWKFLDQYEEMTPIKWVEPEFKILDISIIRALVKEGCPLPKIRGEYKKMFDSPFLQIIMQYCLDDFVPAATRKFVLSQLTLDEFAELIEGVSVRTNESYYFHFLIDDLRDMHSEEKPHRQLMLQIAASMHVSLNKLLAFEKVWKNYPLYLFLADTDFYQNAVKHGCTPFEALICAGISHLKWDLKDSRLDDLSKFKVDKSKITAYITGNYVSKRKFKDIQIITSGQSRYLLDIMSPDSSEVSESEFISKFLPIFYCPQNEKEKLFLSDIRVLFNSLSTDNVLNFVHHLFENPKVMAWIAQNYLYTTSLIIKKSGRHRNTFYSVLYPLLNKLTMAHLNKNESTELHQSYRTHKTPTVLKTLDLTNLRFKRLNRTLVEVNPNGRYLHAFKICKIDESPDEFCKEFSVTANCHSIFQSHFHYPVGLYLAEEVCGLPKILKKHASDGQNLVYHYLANPLYFLYLHDIRKMNEDQYQVGRELFLRDTVKQFLMGIYPFLADMYHNQTTNRPYFALRDILLWIEEKNTQGTGRLEAWEKAIRYPNARASGAADMADAHLLKELLDNPALLGSDFPIFRNEGDKKICIQTNELAKLMLIDMLILVYRKVKENQLNWRNDALCQSLADELMRAQTIIMQSYLSVSYEEAENFVKSCGIDWMLAARQISFWFVPNGENGYAQWVERNKLPLEIYNTPMSKAKGVRVECNSQNFKKNKGYTTFQGTHDIGPFNGPWGLVEMERAWSLITFMCIGMKEYLVVKKECVAEKTNETAQSPPNKRRKVGMGV